MKKTNKISKKEANLTNHFERMRALNESYRQLRSHKELWKEELADRAVLEQCNSDGLKVF